MYERFSDDGEYLILLNRSEKAQKIALPIEFARAEVYDLWTNERKQLKEKLALAAKTFHILRRETGTL